MAERKHGHPTPPTDETIAGADWSDRDISGERHARVKFVDLDLSEVRSRGAVFTECDFRRARFNGSVHEDLSALEPEHVELRGAIVTMDQAITIAIALVLDVRPE